MKFLSPGICCSMTMIPERFTQHKTDGFRWRCTKAKCKKTASLRSRSFFASFSNVRLCVMFEVIFEFFVKGYSASYCFQHIDPQFKAALTTTKRIYKELRNLIKHFMDYYRHPFEAGTRVADMKPFL